MKAISFHLLRRCCLFLIIAASWPAAAEDTNRYADSRWALVDAAKIMAAAAEITPAKFPDCDEATIEKKLVRVYRADGTAEMQDESFVKALTEKGKRNNRTITLSFMLPYSTAAVAKLEVIKPNGSAVTVDIEANSKESIDDSQMAMNIYDPNSKLLQVNIPQLEIGDVVHAVTRQTILRAIVAGEFADENVFEGEGYLRHVSYEVVAPADRPLKSIKLRDEVAGTVKYSNLAGADSSTIHHWEVNDVPRMFGEPAMPPAEMVLQRLLISTTPDWMALSKWYWELSRAHLDATTPDIGQKVKELVYGKETDLEKVKAIFYHVSKNIRYMGNTTEKDRPGFQSSRLSDSLSQIVLPEVGPLLCLDLLGRSIRRYFPFTFSGNKTPLRMSSVEVIPRKSKALKSSVTPSPSWQPSSISMANMI